MPVEIIMPRLGWDMKVGSVAEWLKHDGDEVTSGEAVCLITGDKATTELEALGSGVLRIPSESPPPGEEVPVGHGARLPGRAERGAGPANGAPRSRIVATPRARRAASASGVDWHTVRGTGRGGRILERDILQAASTTPPSAASPRRPTADRHPSRDRRTPHAPPPPRSSPSR